MTKGELLITAERNRIQNCAQQRELLQIYRDLAEANTRLPPEFERVWSENIEELYEP